MAHKTRFLEKLDELWRRKTSRLRTLIGGGHPGPAYKLDTNRRDRLQDELIKAATQSLINRNHSVWQGPSKKEICFYTVKLPRKRNIRFNHIRERWKKFGSPQFFIYSFFKYRRCLKVGRTTRGIERLRGYGDTWMLRDATTLYLMIPNQAPRRNLPKYECIYHHIYSPRKNSMRPSQPRYTKECPICSVEQEIKELMRIFHFR